jgi:two-component system NtrC family sensor kinase
MICKRIVADLMGFARQGDFTFADTSVHRVLDKVLTLTRFQLEKGGVKVVKEWGRDVPALKASEPHLEQVFMNLVANAQQAMPSGGTLTIRSRVLGSADIPDRSADAFNDFPGVAAIEFSDSGVGIKKENLENILEPFFTTKEAGKGTGLGLSICREIVRRHHGEIYVESEGEGRGAKFTVMLPLNGEE